MAKLNTVLPSPAFPFEIDSFVIAANAPTKVRLQLNDQVLFDVEVTPSNGVYRFRRVAPYLIDPLNANGRENYGQQLILTADGQELQRIELIPCSWALDMPAADFLSHSFLSFAGIKRTTLESDELLSAWISPGETSEVLVSARWYNESARKMVRKSHSLAHGPASGYVRRYDVSPRRLIPPTVMDGPWRLLGYRVELGSRLATYEIEPVDALVAPPTTLRFINSFGEPDTFHFFGPSERTVKPKYSEARIHGQLRNYATEVIPERKLKSGPFSPTSRSLFADLAAALDVTDGNGLPLTIAECEMKESNRFADMLYGTMTVRESDELVRVRAKQIFDSTFDLTYE